MEELGVRQGGSPGKPMSTGSSTALRVSKQEASLSSTPRKVPFRASVQYYNLWSIKGLRAPWSPRRNRKAALPQSSAVGQQWPREGRCYPNCPEQPLAGAGRPSRTRCSRAPLGCPAPGGRVGIWGAAAEEWGRGHGHIGWGRIHAHSSVRQRGHARKLVIPRPV